MKNEYQTVTDSIIAKLDAGIAPWVKPWRADQTADINAINSKPYRGINRLLLGMSGMANSFSSNRWGTYKAFADAGGQVRKGEKATHIVFFKPVTYKPADAEPGDKPGQYCILRGYCVFNADQVDGISFAKPETDSAPFNTSELCEQTLVNSGASISHGGDAAFYMPSGDCIRLPHKTAFESAAHYYATSFHELTHWTGAKARLDRNLSAGKFGNPAYAFEELVAELGAAFLCADHHIDGQLRHAEYIGSWLKACRDEPRAIFKAAALAQKAADYVQAFNLRALIPEAIAA